ncbi:MAG: hypothetical protein EA425_12505 [Puniceicoccaceae bacterium]|nr:MAG: hypothetical protein EA425_12505 [Puniceicoccaceae bacterium]
MLRSRQPAEEVFVTLGSGLIGQPDSVAGPGETLRLLSNVSTPPNARLAVWIFNQPEAEPVGEASEWLIFSRDNWLLPALGTVTLNAAHVEPADILRGSLADGQLRTAPLELPPPPLIPTPPASASLVAGQTALFTVDPEGTGPFTFQWFRNGQPIAGATESSHRIPFVSPGQAGAYTVEVSGPGGTTISEAATLAVSPAAELINLSSRGQNLLGSEIMIAGFVLGGSEVRSVLLTGKGPSLADFNLTGLLPDPTLILFDQNGQEIARNTRWEEGPDSDLIDDSGFAPNRETEATLLATIEPNRPYTVHLRNLGNETGIGLVELFDLDRIAGVSGNSRLINLSIRGKVEGGSKIMIAGFVIDHVGGPRRLLIRGGGPSMAAFGVANPLPDPVLSVWNADRERIDLNEYWRDHPEAELIESTGFAPGDDLEAALLITLEPGAYTVQLRDSENRPGIGRIELFTLP